MDDSRKLNLVKASINYMWGALWWGKESFIMSKCQSWIENDRKGHPLLSLRRNAFVSNTDVVPMFIGTSSISRERPSLLINVSDEILTDFGTIVEPIIVQISDFIYREKAIQSPRDLNQKIWDRRTLWPNIIKPNITQEESDKVNAFIQKRRNVALNNGGYNHA